MKVSLSELDRLGVWSALTGNVWGGPEMLQQLAVWDALRLDDFMVNDTDAKDRKLGELGRDAEPFDVPDEAIDCLKQLLLRPGQPAVFGRSAARVLKCMP